MAATKIETFKVNTLDEISKVSQKVFAETKSRWWFRGQVDCARGLQPKIWRGYDPQTERYMSNLFYQGAKLRHGNFPDAQDFAGWLALMQHYGLPTRLLDWSESPLIAAYFAVKYRWDLSGIGSDTDAAIWMLQPESLNASQKYGAVYPSLDAEGVASLCYGAFGELDPTSTRESRRPSPYNALATVPVNHDLRMVMQQGVFTIHGDKTALESFPSSDSWLKKLEIPLRSCRDIAMSLDAFNIRLSDVFPDVHHLAIQITNMHPAK